MSPIIYSGSGVDEYFLADFEVVLWFSEDSSLYRYRLACNSVLG